ncbi:MAG: PEGA domain-containing protein [Polyangiaceae bacterium]
MKRVFAIATALCAFFMLLGSAHAANPKAPPMSYVIPFASDDAEENADGFSGALRARVRAAAGWTLGEASDTLELYTTALRCPERPDTACLERMGAQLKTDRFFWGFLKRTQKGQVLVEVHLWRKLKGDSSTTETYSDNLKDQNDEVLRRIAGHAFAKLAGEVVPALLTINVRPAETEGVVLVDGKEQAPIDHGQATVELKPGTHAISVRASGFKTAQNQISIDAGKELALDVKLEPGADTPAPSSKPIPARKILGIGGMVAGGGFLIAGIIESANFLSLQSQNSRDASGASTTNFCAIPDSAPCSTLRQAKTARVLSVVFYGVAAVLGGGGAILFLTDHSGDEASASSKSAWRVIPDVGPHRGSLDFALTF